MANSNGVLRMPEAYFDAVRPGLIVYGLLSRQELRDGSDLHPVLSMRTRIGHIKRVAQGEGIGYGHTFTTWRPSVIATIPVGYYDGYLRQFSNVGEVLVRGCRAPVVGRVCMDQALIDVTDVPQAALGDEVMLYGRQGDDAISVEEMAARVNRIPYELTCALSPRVRREFVRGGEVVVETPFRSVVPREVLRQGLLKPVTPDDGKPVPGPAKRGAA
jgi:alanine racemase